VLYSAPPWRLTMARTGRPRLTDDAIWRRIDRSGGAASCWLYTGPVNSSGYGTIHDRPAHRWVYERLVGPIPTGLPLDHTCRVRRCVNPAHLEPVTVRENVMRSSSFAAKNARKSKCPQGHPLDGLRGNGYRYCKRCAREAEREKRARRRAANPPPPKQTHCREGHPLWGANVYVTKTGYRQCKSCHRAYLRRWRKQRGGNDE
jgi:hypothetical protein